MREVPLFITTPIDLKNYEVDLISNIVFCKEDMITAPPPLHASTIFCFSSPVGANEQAKVVKSVIEAFESSVNHVVLTGKDGVKYGGEPVQSVSQAEVLYTALKPIPAGITISLENTSTNTLENAQHGFEALKKTMGDTVAICSRAFNLGRCMRTFRVVAEQKGWSGSISYLPYYVSGANDGTGLTITADNWNQHEGPRSRVFSELARIVTYGGRRDLYLSDKDKRDLSTLQPVISMLLPK